MSEKALRLFDEARAEMSAKAMAKLPPQDQIATDEMCLDGAEALGGGWKCSKQKGHPPAEGHAAHGLFGVVARW